MEIKPLSKEEVKRAKTIPDIIIKTVNKLLIKNYCCKIISKRGD